MSAILLPEPEEPELARAMLAGTGAAAAAAGGMVTPPRKGGAASAASGYGFYDERNDAARSSPDTVLGALTPTKVSTPSAGTPKGGTPTAGTPKAGTPLKPSTPDSSGRRTPLGGGGGTLATPGNYRELQQRLLSERLGASAHGATGRSHSSPAARPPPSPQLHYQEGAGKAAARAELLTPRTGGFPVPRLTSGLRSSPPSPSPSPPLYPGGFSAGRAPLAPAPRRPPPSQRPHGALQRPPHVAARPALSPGYQDSAAAPPARMPPSLATRSRFGSAGATAGRADALPAMVR